MSYREDRPLMVTGTGGFSTKQDQSAVNYLTVRWSNEDNLVEKSPSVYSALTYTLTHLHNIENAYKYLENSIGKK